MEASFNNIYAELTTWISEICSSNCRRFDFLIMATKAGDYTYLELHQS